MGNDKRILLLEFVTHERWVFNSRFFPFIKGCAEGFGFETLWLCFGSRFCHEKQGKTGLVQYMDLNAEEMAFFKKQIREFRPTHTVISHAVSEPVMGCLSAGGAGNQILVNFDDPYKIISLTEPGKNDPRKLASNNDESKFHRELGYGDSNWYLGRTNWLLAWLGENGEPSPYFNKYIVGTFPPSYDVLMANESARSFKPHLLIMGGVSCDHFSPVTQNTYYQNLDLSCCTHDYGCSYCTWYRGATSNMQENPVKFAEEQFARILKTAGDNGRNSCIFEVSDIRLFRLIDKFFDMILRLEFPPSTFCFEPRIDRFLEVEQKLEEVMPRLKSAGHKVYLQRMGAENLVEEESERFNKNITLEQIDKATKRLKDFRSKHSETFDYDPTYGYITCSPWTTLEMFETGLEGAVERGFEPLGVWLYTPLLLYKSAPITQLARQEGDVIVDEFEDPALLYVAAANQVAFDNFVPWKFKDERTGVAFGLIVRFCAFASRAKYPDTIFCGDSLYEQLLDATERYNVPFDRPDIFAREVIAVIKEYPVPYEKPLLLDVSIKSYIRKCPVLEAGDKYDAYGKPASASEPSFDDSDIIQRQGMLQRVFASVLERFPERFENLSVCVQPTPLGSIALTVQISDSGYDILLSKRDPTAKYLFQSEHLNISHRQETPLTSPQDKAKVKFLVQVLEKAIVRIVPDLLPK